MSDFTYDEEEAEEQRAEGIHGDEEDYGSCPACGGSGEMVAEGRRHWMVCHRDKLKWRVGTGFFVWLLGVGDKWDRAGDWIKAYRQVEPDKTPTPSPEVKPRDDDEERLKRMFE